MKIKRLNESNIDKPGKSVYLSNDDFIKFLDYAGKINSIYSAINSDIDNVEDREVSYNDVLYYADWIDEVSGAMRKMYNDWITDSKVNYGRI